MCAIGWLALGLVIAYGGRVLAHTADEAQALVERAAAHIEAIEREQAFADFSNRDGGFVNGDLYVFCLSRDGSMLATVELNRVAQTQGHGWVEYLWPNPATGRIQPKLAYVLRIDDQTECGSGFYLPDPP